MIVEFGSAIGGLRTAVELVRGVAAADRALNEADLKLKLLGAINDMVAAQMALIDARQAIEDRDSEIERLRAALEIKGSVELVNSAYYMKNAEGRPTGHGYCMRCYEVESKLRHLAYGGMMMSDPVLCPTCGTKYVYSGVYPLG